MMNEDTILRMQGLIGVLERIEEQTTQAAALALELPNKDCPTPIREYFQNVPEILAKVNLLLHDISAEMTGFVIDLAPVPIPSVAGWDGRPFTMELDDEQLLIIPGVDE